MALNKNRFATIGGQGRGWSAPQVFSYSAPGITDLATSSGDGYLNDLQGSFRVGDFIFIVAVGASSKSGGLYIVKGETVQLAEITKGTAW